MRRFFPLAALTAAILTLLVFTAASPAAAQTTGLSTTCDNTGAHTARMYRTLFARTPDRAGLDYWVTTRTGGASSNDVAYWMTQQAEYVATYGGTATTVFVDTLYLNLLDRAADPEGRAYWARIADNEGRHVVADWMTRQPEFAAVWPYQTSRVCQFAATHSLTPIGPGVAANQVGVTVTAAADHHLATVGVHAGAPAHAAHVPGLVAVNANWFTKAGHDGPLVVDGLNVGGRDSMHRGQLVVRGPECGGGFDHRWQWDMYTPGGGCDRAVVSGVSLVHKGVRADAYPGADLTSGYTNQSKSHSFVGYTADQLLVVVSTREMNASELADYVIGLGVVEGVMLDGGGSTQVKAGPYRVAAGRAVPSFLTIGGGV